MLLTKRVQDSWTLVERFFLCEVSSAEEIVRAYDADVYLDIYRSMVSIGSFWLFLFVWLFLSNLVMQDYLLSIAFTRVSNQTMGTEGKNAIFLENRSFSCVLVIHSASRCH